MGTTLATKADLELLRTAVRQDILLVKADVELLRTEVRQDILLVKADLELLRTELRKDLEHLPALMTVRLGSLIVVGLGVLFAALKLT